MLACDRYNRDNLQMCIKCWQEVGAVNLVTEATVEAQFRVAVCGVRYWGWAQGRPTAGLL